MGVISGAIFFHLFTPLGVAVINADGTVQVIAAVQPAPKEYTSFVRIDAAGRVLQVGHATHDGSFGPATTAIDHDGALYFGSLSARGIARVRAQ